MDTPVIAKGVFENFKSNLGINIYLDFRFNNLCSKSVMARPSGETEATVLASSNKDKTCQASSSGNFKGQGGEPKTSGNIDFPAKSCFLS